MSSLTVLCTRRRLAVWLALLSISLTALAAYENGRLLAWDEPTQRFVESHRLSALNDVIAALSHLGSTVLLWPITVGVVILIWPRCRAVSLAIMVAAVGSIVTTYGLKALVDRERPDTSPLVDTDFQSFPSGHAINAVALWGMLPVVIGLLSSRRQLRKMSVAVVAAVIVVVAASRIYLGVHWLSDVLVGLLVGAAVLLTADAALRYVHDRGRCAPNCARSADREDSTLVPDRRPCAPA